MKRTFLILALAVILLMATVAGASAHGKGNSPASLGGAGWACMDIPNLGVHCFPPGAVLGSPSVSVKVFDTNDINAEHATVLGTEILIRGDIYAHGQQPCATDGGGLYHDLSQEDPNNPYFACHHYSTH